MNMYQSPQGSINDMASVLSYSARVMMSVVLALALGAGVLLPADALPIVDDVPVIQDGLPGSEHPFAHASKDQRVGSPTEPEVGRGTATIPARESRTPGAAELAVYEKAPVTTVRFLDLLQLRL